MLCIVWIFTVVDTEYPDQKWVIFKKEMSQNDFNNVERELNTRAQLFKASLA